MLLFGENVSLVPSGVVLAADAQRCSCGVPVERVWSIDILHSEISYI